MKLSPLPLLIALALVGAGCSSSTDIQVNTNTPPQPAPQMKNDAEVHHDDSMMMDDKKDDGSAMDAHVDANMDAKVDVGGTKVDVGTKTDVKVAMHAISIQNFAFSQTSLKVKKGDKVVFTNKDSVGHSSTADDGAWDSGVLSTNGTFTLDTSKLAPGTYGYHCTPHPMMKATLIVE